MSAKPSGDSSRRNPAPKAVDRVVRVGTLLGAVLLLLFCASALAGYAEWTVGIGLGLGQFGLYIFLAMSVRNQRRWAWWVLTILTLVNTLLGLEHGLRLLQVGLAGRLGMHTREHLFDGIGLVQVVVGLVLLRILFSKDVRGHAHRAKV